MPELQSGSERRLIREVLDFIRANDMLAHGDALLLGVSGGPDSTALAWLMAEIAPVFALRLGIAHLNHQLRGAESDRDAAFVEALARRMNLPFHCDSRDVKQVAHDRRLSLEEAGREVRRMFLAHTARRHGYTKIALGHHADDNAELVLMFLLRGAGPAGLSGMGPVSDSGVIRPLLGVSRTDILEYLTENGIDYVTDASNRDVTFTRNRIRHRLIPLLEQEYNPQISRRLNDLAAVFRDEETWLHGVAAKLLAKVTTAADENRITLTLSGLNALPSGAARRVIREALRRLLGNLRRIAFTHVEAVRRLADPTASGTGQRHLLRRIRVIRNGNALTFRRENQSLRRARPAFPGFEHTVSGPGTTELPEIGKRLRLEVMDAAEAGHPATHSPDRAWLDLDRLGFPMTVRNRRPGDRFRPLGMTGTRKLKDFFIDIRVPQNRRDHCPILIWRDRIVWVGGHRIADDFKITQATRKVLKAELLLA